MNLTNNLVLGLAIAWAIPAVSQPLSWDFPRDHSCHEGLAFSDGKTGLLVWGGGDTIRVTVGRGDLWDHRGGYPWTPEQSYSNVVAAVERGDGAYLKTLFHKKPVPGEPNNPMLLPLGRVEITVAGARLVSGTLDPLTGLGRLTYAVDSRTAFVDLALSKAAGAFVLRFSPDAKRTVRVVSSMESPRVANALGPIGYKAPRTVEGGFIWDLPADPAVGLFAAEKDDTCVISTGRGECRPAVVGFDAAKTDSLDRWSRFWREGVRVSLPDPVLQQAFEYGMYRYGSMTDPDGFPAGLQGPWLEDDRLIPWNGDYHFNINVQECYSPSFRGGHFRNVRRLFDMILAWRPRLRENARLFCGIGDGYVLPHSVDDRGTCIGGFWTGTVDHGSTAWMADLMFRYVRYSRDLDFLKNGAYDFMCGAMRVYLAMLREEGGRLVLPVGPSPEWGGADPKHAVGRNPSFQLAIIHRLAADLDEAERLMKAKGEGWCRRVAGLPKYTLGKRGIALWEGQDLTYTHRHHSHLAGFYPFDVIDLEKDRAVVEMTYFNWADHGTASWAGWSHPWASVLFTHVGDAAAAHWMLRTWERFFCNPGHGSRHDVYHPGLSVARRGANGLRFGVSGDAKGEEIMQMDGQCATVSAVLEMLAHDVNGETKFFRGCPDDWREVSFENLALADGRRVSGRRANGKVEIREGVDAGRRFLVVGPTPQAETLSVRISPGESWWGLCNAFGHEMPITERSRFDWDLTENNYGSQTESVLVSDRGRIVFSREPLRIVCTNGVLTCRALKDAEIVFRDDCGADLRSAFRWVSKNCIPPTGEEPELLYFAAPQYNTWIELTYHQNEKDILVYARSMLDHGLPPGILMIDDTWQLGYGTWEFDPRRFPDPKGMVEKLHAMGFKVLLWTCPWVSMDSPEYRRIQLGVNPDDVKGWPTCGGFLTRQPVTAQTPHPEAAPVKWWNGYSALLDFTHPNAVAWYAEQLDRLRRDYGVDAFKFDGGSIRYYVGADAPKTCIDAVDVSGGGELYAYDRTVSAVRQSYLYGAFALKYRGSEYRCGFGFGGKPVIMRLHDKDHSWRDLSLLVPAMLASGLIGVPFICPDMVGGGQWAAFLPGAPFSQELFIRSAEVQALCPMMQISASPWRVLDARHQEIFRKIVALRQRFAPYFVRLARQAAKDGEPMMRYLEYAYPHRGYAAINDEFLMGEDLLVAPVVTEGAVRRKVVIPPGDWIADDGAKVTGPTAIEVEAPLERLPYFVKAERRP